MQKEHNWYYEMNGYAKGPFTKAELTSRFQNQQLSATTKIKNAQMTEWVEAGSIDEFAPFVQQQQRSMLRFNKPFVANQEGISDALSLRFFDDNMQNIATFKDRAIALCIDASLLGSVIFVLLSFDVPIISILKRDTLAYSLPSLSFIFLILGWVYFTFVEYIWQGSIGKLLMKLKIVTDIGNGASFEQLTGRYFIKVFSILAFGIGCFMMLKSKKGKTLHDTVAETLVKQRSRRSK